MMNGAFHDSTNQFVSRWYQKKSQSADPITAYKARLEIGIYTWLLDLIEKELEAEEATDTVTEIAGAQVA